MTVSYAGTFLRLLFHWRGSVWKAIWRELLLWLILYYSLRFILDKGLGQQQKETTKAVIKTIQTAANGMPIAFMLAFYVTQVLTRWWTQIQSLPWPDETISLVNAHLNKGDTVENLSLRRHTIARYLILTQIIALRGVSSRIRKRFPSTQHLVECGLMNTEEYQMMMNCPCANLRWQLPLIWAQNLIVPLVGISGNLISPTSATSIYKEINQYRSALRSVFLHDWVSIPLVYTQATGVGLYGYFLLSLLGRQTLADDFETWIPLGAILKFFIYVGWFRVAQDLLKPFGEYDDDVELNYLIDRHLNVAMTMARQPNIKGPTLKPDQLFGQRVITIPHTKLSADIGDGPPKIMATFQCKSADDITYNHISDSTTEPNLKNDKINNILYL